MVQPGPWYTVELTQMEATALFVSKHLLHAYTYTLRCSKPIDYVNSHPVYVHAQFWEMMERSDLSAVSVLVGRQVMCDSMH